MNPRLTVPTALLLTVPPLMWACNAVLGRALGPVISPMTLNLLRWALAGLFLLPLATWVLRPRSGLWPYWRRFALLGLLIGCYNALQYLALHTSTPINVTLVAASTPVWMLLIGRWFFGASISARQWLGAALSITGVLLVLGRGELGLLLKLRLVAGDLYILLASFTWAFYSWMLAQTDKEPVAIRSDWAAFLMGQIVFGLVWSGVFAAGEWALTDAHIDWSWPLLAALLFIAAGPALLAYSVWGTGVQRAGPTMASFFANLTPLLAALLSSALLGETPHAYHGLAFALIVGGIVVSARRKTGD
jgi:drug/metabolite transporter (DMT)-like permease